MIARSLRAAALMSATALVLVGCAPKVEEALLIQSADLEVEVADQLQEEVGVRPDITCDEDLIGEVGAEVVCTLHAEEGTLQTTVTVNEVDEEEKIVYFDIEVKDPAAPTG